MQLRLAFLLLALPAVLALDNGLGRTPQMGWNSWNHFACGIEENLIRATAEAMVTSGLKDAGYEYINLDDCWQTARDKDGSIIADPKAFPNGIKALADYVHSLGLKFGVYSDAGYKTCAGRPASLGYEKIDAATYASWGVDYLKYDNCNDDGTKPETRYPPMRDALNATGRPIFFSMCEWGVDDPATWAPAVGNSWRTTGDISDNFDSMTSNLDQNDRWWNLSGPGAWNDPDMLEVGNGGMTFAEYRAHMSLWALIKSPLLVGCDIRNMSSETLYLLTNPEVIAVNQDQLGVQGHRISNVSNLEVWAGPQADGSVVVVLFNRTPARAAISFAFKDVGVQSSNADIRDLWARDDLGQYTGEFMATVDSHDVVMLKVTPSSSEEEVELVEDDETF